MKIQNAYFGKDRGLCCFTIFSRTVEVLQKTLPYGHIKQQQTTKKGAQYKIKEERGLIERKPKTMTEREHKRRRKRRESTVITAPASL